MSNTGVIAIIGGTGALGGGLAYRFAAAGRRVVLGSRDGAKARAAADAMRAELQAAGKSADLEGMDNLEAATAGDVVIVTVPFASQRATLAGVASALGDKLVIDATVPLVPPKVARVQLPPEGSAAAVALAALGGAGRLVTAFHNVSADKLRKGEAIEADVLVFGDDVAARSEAVDLAQALGVRGVHGGPLDNAVAAEAMTSVLISINKRYKVADGAGVKITGVDAPT